MSQPVVTNSDTRDEKKSLTNLLIEHQTVSTARRHQTLWMIVTAVSVLDRTSKSAGESVLVRPGGRNELSIVVEDVLSDMRRVSPAPCAVPCHCEPSQQGCESYQS